MPYCVHAFMQHSDDLDDARSYDAIEDHMHWIGDGGLATFVAAVANMETANAG